MEYPVRIQLTALTIGLAGVLAACSQPQQQQQQQPTEQTAEAPATIHARGVVRALTPEYNAITIEHEAIPEVGMGAMTMEFTVAQPASLDGINVGDHVSFELSGPLDIQSITVTETN